MAPGRRIAPGDEDTVALASGDAHCSRSQSTREKCKSGASYGRAACSPGRRK